MTLECPNCYTQTFTACVRSVTGDRMVKCDGCDCTFTLDKLRHVRDDLEITEVERYRPHGDPHHVMYDIEFDNGISMLCSRDTDGEIDLSFSTTTDSLSDTEQRAMRNLTHRFIDNASQYFE